MEKEHYVSICYGEAFEFYNQSYDQSGTYTETLTTEEGCKITETLHLIVEEEFSQNIETAICEGDTLVIDNKNYTQAGTYYNTYVSANGCDSIVALHLTVNQPKETNITINLCPGESFSIDDQELVVTVAHDG